MLLHGRLSKGFDHSVATIDKGQGERRCIGRNGESLKRRRGLKNLDIQIGIRKHRLRDDSRKRGSEAATEDSASNQGTQAEVSNECAALLGVRLDVCLLSLPQLTGAVQIG